MDSFTEIYGSEKNEIWMIFLQWGNLSSYLNELFMLNPTVMKKFKSLDLIEV